MCGVPPWGPGNLKIFCTSTLLLSGSKEIPTMKTSRTRLFSILFVACVSTAALPTASAQYVIQNYGGFGASGSIAPLSVGQPRIVGFVPATHSGIAAMSRNHSYSIATSGAVGGQIMSYSVPVQSGVRHLSPGFAAPVGFSTLGVPVRSAGVSGFTYGASGQHGRIIKYRYRVPVYGRVSQPACGSVSGFSASSTSASSTSALTPQPEPEMSQSEKQDSESNSDQDKSEESRTFSGN